MSGFFGSGSIFAARAAGGVDNIVSKFETEAKVSLRYWEPSEELRYFFGSMYLFSASSPDYRDMTRADMPQMRFMISAGGEYEFHDGRRAKTPEICMIGPTMGATRFELDGPARVLGVSVLPLGWLALTNDSAHDWADRLCDLEKNGDSGYRERLNALRQCSDIDAEVEKTWAFLEARLKPVPSAMIDLVAKIDAWLSDSDSPLIDEIVEATGLSARQLARYTNRLYGAPPKLLARKYRALRCASQIVIDKKNWNELCDEGNFYDQSHFIREIKQFLGHTPHQLLSDPTAVARLTVQRRALTGLMKLNRIS